MKVSVSPRLRLALSLCTALSAVSLPAAPILLDDTYAVQEDVPLVIPAPGVLANDTADPPGAAMSPAVSAQPAHGTVSFNTDGSFTYTPAAEYSGPDSFSYSVLGTRQFTIDQSRSILAINAKATISLGTSNSSDTGRVNGNETIYLNPPVSPFQQAQVQDIYVNLAERVDLKFSWFFGLATLDAHINANELQIDMVTPGPAGTVAANGTFNQPATTVRAVGTAYLTASGLASSVEVPPTIQLNGEVTYDLTNCQVTTVGSNLEMKLPLTVTQQFVDPGGAYTVDVTISGNIFAVAPVNPVPAAVTATVNLNVTSVDDLPVAVGDRYYTRQNLLLAVPAAAVAATDTLIASGSAWKFSTGTDLGTAWRNPEFDDSAWAAGNAVLGYGDNDVSAQVPPRADPGSAASAGNPNYPTCYFRKSFILNTPFDTLVPEIEVMRDDAAIIWLNGIEIYRDKDIYPGGTVAPLPATGEVPYGTYAAEAIPNADELIYKEITISRGLLREGSNVIAVAIKQAGATSSDLRFDLRMTRTTGVAGVLANDTDPDGPAMSAALHRPAANGAVVLNADGSFTYAGAPGFSGMDSFVYKITDSFGVSRTSETTLIPFGGSWKYLDNGTAAPQNAGITPADWRNAAFDDASWKSGAAKLGYGEADIVTTVEDDATPNSPTPGSTTRYITTYFRHKFTPSTNLNLVESLKARVIRDDGVAVWLNGHRIMRDNLPENFTSATPAQTAIGGADETTPVEAVNIPAAWLLPGENIVAAEIHQSARDSSDVSFALELIALNAAGATVEVIVLDDDADNDHVSDTWERANGFDPTAAADGAGDADGDGATNRDEFLAGSDPRDAASRFGIVNTAAASGGGMDIEFSTAPGRNYRLQYSTALGAWTDSGPVITAAGGTSTTVTAPPLSASQRFFRLKLLNDWQ